MGDPDHSPEGDMSWSSACWSAKNDAQAQSQLMVETGAQVKRGSPSAVGRRALGSPRHQTHPCTMSSATIAPPAASQPSRRNGSTPLTGGSTDRATVNAMYSMVPAANGRIAIASCSAT